MEDAPIAIERNRPADILGGIVADVVTCHVATLSQQPHDSRTNQTAVAGDENSHATTRGLAKNVQGRISSEKPASQETWFRQTGSDRLVRTGSIRTTTRSDRVYC